jgi:3-oxoacyl-[acyl-carrier protein] reductase
MKLNDKAALVTGAGTGVGRATAIMLAQHGCHVGVNYARSREAAEQTAADCRALGVKAIAVQADVADDAVVRQMAAAVEDAFGRLDVLVNCAGTTRFINHANLEKVTDDDWHRILDVNLLGPFHTIRAVKELMLRSGGGEIINISSVAGLQASGSSIPYCASKAALINMTIALARVLAPTIRVNNVAPGFITGRWLEEGLGRDAYERTKKAFEQGVPTGKVCDPEDIAATVLGIIVGSDNMTGQTIVVDGGQTIAMWQNAIGRQ